MSRLNSQPGVAIIFALLAIGTAAVLVLEVSMAAKYTFAIFWGLTGLLALYVALRALREG